MSQIGDDDSRQVGNYLSILKEHSMSPCLKSHVFFQPLFIIDRLDPFSCVYKYLYSESAFAYHLYIYNLFLLYECFKL